MNAIQVYEYKKLMLSYSIMSKILLEGVFVEFKKVSEIVKDNTLLNVCSSNNKSIKVFFWQPYGEFEADNTRGVVLETTDFVDKATDFIKKAKEMSAQLVLTPEYCFPHETLNNIIENKTLWPEKGCLWCLGAQGDSKINFKQKMETWSAIDDVVVDDYAFNTLTVNTFVSPLIYLFRKDDSKLYVLTQFKVEHMKDPWHDFESNGLCTGSVIFVFDLNGNERCRNSFLSVICADVFRIKSDNILDDKNVLEENILVFHPQLNPKPRHIDFRTFRNGLISNNGKKVRVITLNWAEKTTTILNGKIIKFKIPFSAFYTRSKYKTSDGDHRELRRKNFKKGLFYAYNRETKIDIWYSHPSENCKLMYINKEFSCESNSASDLEEPDTKKCFLFDVQSKEWQSDILPCRYDLDTILQSNGDDYDFPLELCKRNMNTTCACEECNLDACDFFFSLCFGENEETELTADNELVKRLLMGSDEESNNERKHKATIYNQLVNQLKNNNFPLSFEHFKDNHKMEIYQNYPNVGMEVYNLSQKVESLENTDIKAIVAITKSKHSEYEIQTLIDQLSGRMHERFRKQVLVYYDPSDGRTLIYYDKYLEQSKLTKGIFTENKASIFNSDY